VLHDVIHTTQFGVNPKKFFLIIIIIFQKEPLQLAHHDVIGDMGTPQNGNFIS
jgi:hypothetical protein